MRAFLHSVSIMLAVMLLSSTASALPLDVTEAVGLEVGAKSSYSGYTVEANTLGSIFGFAGNTGGNLCNGGACP